ncbi:lipoate--protein ligase family protein [Salinicoccus halodurans]|uniref:Octanoyl-[GcvH]:protein N-octanoyltransferase n=1 Tax=Salinicoccus halodurans TaxID=407035 RepID=A0A0F7HN74_9STAP|nr:lipoate--protein ligase family protein [Salinicoccus halodurans]AKG75056.1 lipoate--protein ligase [Salinicoccus halodurans]SFK65204.1 octanoyl-[GcvH]:protein N-octanoyltransferase [Salinicoccus halodurans]
MDNLFDRHWQYIPAEAVNHPYQSFAMDDLLQEMVTADGIPKIRAWVHDPYIILGLHDARLPNLNDGLKFLEDSGYDYILRNSGGLGVVLDDGVLNISLILPKSAAPQIDDGYDLMLAMVRSAFPHAPVEAYEIVHSYCPGSYDLSIGGRKFAGISQRRIRQGIAVQIYLCVTGSGSLRAEIMRDFYHYSKSDDITRFKYPEVHPEDMASLNELLGENYRVEDVLRRMIDVIEASGGTLEDLPGLSEEQQERYDGFLKRMKQRNEKIRMEKDNELFSGL